MSGESTPGMPGLEAGESTAENYRRFARLEAGGRSAAYERLALAMADDPVLLRYVESLPRLKRQPNLLFSAATYLLGERPDHAALRELVAGKPDALAAVMLARRTQTNEAARCAALLPALMSVRPPLALIEVGASAGLTLLADCYSYDYAGHRVPGADLLAPVLACEPRGDVPLPSRVPEVFWREGLDLNPLDPGDPGDAHWLECLLWPGEAGRAERLAAAIGTARRNPVRVHRGDLLDDLAAVAAKAPPEATLVIFHTAVLAYVDERKRRDFAAEVRRLGAVWLSQEAPGVVAGTRDPGVSHFLLVRDGGEVLARTDPHGAWVEWLAS